MEQQVSAVSDLPESSVRHINKACVVTIIQLILIAKIPQTIQFYKTKKYKQKHNPFPTPPQNSY